MTPYNMSGLSWSGFNVFGDRDSIDAVSLAIHSQATVQALRERLWATEAALNAAREAAAARS